MATENDSNSNEIDIDSVTEAAGTNFENWIQTTKEKLKQRENKAMNDRVSTLIRIIREQCKLFENINSSNSALPKVFVAGFEAKSLDNIRTDCMNKLDLILLHWNGINLSKTKRKLTSFRKYYGSMSIC